MVKYDLDIFGKQGMLGSLVQLTCGRHWLSCVSGHQGSHEQCGLGLTHTHTETHLWLPVQTYLLQTVSENHCDADEMQVQRHVKGHSWVTAARVEFSKRFPLYYPWISEQYNRGWSSLKKKHLGPEISWVKSGLQSNMPSCQPTKYT